MLELRDVYRGVAVHATEDEEHEAALELLLLVMLADGRISADEQETVEQITEDLEWNSPSFSFTSAFGAAMAKVREARLEIGGIDRLVGEVDDRIASRVLRSELLAACRDVADADRERSAEEVALLHAIGVRFSGSAAD